MLHDTLTDVETLADAVSNWRSMLRHGLEAGGTAAEGENVAEAIEARLRTGRPLAADEWIRQQEDVTGRTFRPRKPGPKPKAA
ncbi:hypothetical protein ACFCW2_04710 [Qipengyuania sp. DSG2-2]|uniref:hypothetical protein n=1 Tax=Qipengyuania sp. DGS2-2 TaxID=3349631 RepID=UPI0036D405ED